MTVLVVEDEEDIRTIVRMSLEQLGGFTVIDTASGAEALEVVRRLRPDVVLLDVMMPDMDGPQLLEALRSRADTSTLPVIFLTAKAMPDEIERLRALGALAIFTKPFDPVALPDLIRRALESGGTTPVAPPVSEAGRSPASRNAGMIDAGALEKLAGLTGESGRDLMGELIDLFEATTPDTLRRLRAVVRTGDGALGARLGHSLKGSAGTLGATGIAGVAADIEELCRTGRTGDLMPHIERIDGTFGATLERLRHERARLTGES
jgi:two-component system OmpR family response regulator